MKKNQLIENAKAKNCKVNTNDEKYIGIQFPSKRYDGLWHWFDVTEFLGEEEVWFNHSYSVNTGRSFKGTRHRMAVKDKLGFYA